MVDVVMIAAPLCTGVSSFGASVAHKLRHFTSRNWIFFDYDLCYPKAVRAECVIQTGHNPNGDVFARTFDAIARGCYLHAINEFALQEVNLVVSSPFDDLLSDHEGQVAFEFIKSSLQRFHFFALTALLWPSQGAPSGRDHFGPINAQTIVNCPGMVEVDAEFRKRLAQAYEQHPFHYGDKLSAPEIYALAAQRTLRTAEKYQLPIVRASVKDTAKDLGHRVFETIRLNNKRLQA